MSISQYFKPNDAVKPSGAPQPGEAFTVYRINGIFLADGTYVVPEALVITLSNGRVSAKPGDTMPMTRAEAAVVGKNVSLTPLVAIS